MTREEYERSLEHLTSVYKKRVYNLRVDYSLSINPYKVGDVIEDHIGKGQILSIHPGWDGFRDGPEIRYYCVNLTKKGEVNKREPERNIYYSNLKK